MKHGDGNILACFLEEVDQGKALGIELKWVLNFIVMTQYNMLLLGRAWMVPACAVVSLWPWQQLESRMMFLHNVSLYVQNYIIK